ncbi:MAG: outer membrane beta-barrel protein [Flavobacterium sp.]|uniref:outer membrane beta-barrel protein n=1 Tax=Flavobacterium sp. TaxID=239 RepID=UPI0022BEA8B4|nr:outer membrane beta-barrel protein [Flavobacterium sp.]MCZ8332235.1 outer membrane beta-barrel protein [Flavobacterium sp.]
MNFIKQKTIVIIMLLCSLVLESKAQIHKKNTFYISAAAGLARAEDGLQFLKKTDATQWAPMVNIGVGYKLFKNISLELNSSFMVTNLKAEGTLVTNNEKVEVKANHANIFFNSSFNLPINERSELFFKPGIGLLFSNSEITSTSSAAKIDKSVSNVGFVVTLGYMKRITNKLALTTQFDFSDSYGSKEVWEGDLGLLSVGIKYAINND